MQPPPLGVALNNKNSSPEEQYHTVQEIANRLNVSVATVYREIGRGHLRAVRIGRRNLRVTTAAIDDYVATQQTNGRPQP